MNQLAMDNVVRYAGTTTAHQRADLFFDRSNKVSLLLLPLTVTRCCVRALYRLTTTHCRGSFSATEERRVVMAATSSRQRVVKSWLK